MSETENNELTAGKQSKEPRSNQKLKLLYLAKILLNNTDANHDITLEDTMKMCGVSSLDEITRDCVMTF